jgi:hypothetical protein
MIRADAYLARSAALVCSVVEERRLTWQAVRQAYRARW